MWPIKGKLYCNWKLFMMLTSSRLSQSSHSSLLFCGESLDLIHLVNTVSQHTMAHRQKLRIASKLWFSIMSSRIFFWKGWNFHWTENHKSWFGIFEILKRPKIEIISPPAHMCQINNLNHAKLSFNLRRIRYYTGIMSGFLLFNLRFTTKLSSLNCSLTLKKVESLQTKTRRMEYGPKSFYCF